METTEAPGAKTLLVTGSNRGIGLELVRQCVRDGWRVLAHVGSQDSGKFLRFDGREEPW